MIDLVNITVMKKISEQLLNSFLYSQPFRIYPLIIVVFFGFQSVLRAQDHLLLSEITLQTADAEFIEIFNPTDEIKMLEDYYLADNQNYPAVTSIPSPFVDLGDFIVRFPNGTIIEPNEVIVIASNGADFENYYGQAADFEIISADDNTPDMVSINQNMPGISNAGEGIALFFWNGNDDLMQDVDLMNAGIPTETSEILDKSSLPGYQADAHTIPYQISAAGDGFSTKRILLEGIHETHSGGNGITEDDETSEDISVTWDQVYSAPTPGITDLMSTGILGSLVIDGSITVFPNPTRSDLNLLIETHANECKIQIQNAAGHILLTKVHSNIQEAKLLQFDLSEYINGIYSILIQLDEDILIRKVIVKV